MADVPGAGAVGGVVDEDAAVAGSGLGAEKYMSVGGPRVEPALG